MKNNKYWDETMFALLENEKSQDERIALLQEINSDHELKKKWELWKLTKFHQEKIISQDFIKKLKKEESVFTLNWLPLTMTGCVLVAVFYFYFQNTVKNQSIDRITKIKNFKKPNKIFAADALSFEDTIKRINTDLKSKKTNKPDSAGNTYVLNSQKDKLEFFFNNAEGIILEPSIINSTLKDSTEENLISELKFVITQESNLNTRARGDEVKVTIQNIESSEDQLAITPKLNSVLKKYQIAGPQKKYEIIQEMCDGEILCYSLVIAENNFKTKIRL